ncbi:MAG: hypothetical protein D6785_02200, partial [Planctomycetota bacterium]
MEPEESPSNFLDSDFWRVLKGVSRSFYLSMYFLPSETRKIIGLAYALARAADTLADTEFVPKEKRNKGLSLFQKALEDRFHQEAEGNAEKELVQ